MKNKIKDFYFCSGQEENKADFKNVAINVMKMMKHLLGDTNE